MKSEIEAYYFVREPMWGLQYPSMMGLAQCFVIDGARHYLESYYLDTRRLYTEYEYGTVFTIPYLDMFVSGDELTIETEKTKRKRVYTEGTIAQVKAIYERVDPLITAHVNSHYAQLESPAARATYLRSLSAYKLDTRVKRRRHEPSNDMDTPEL